MIGSLLALPIFRPVSLLGAPGGETVHIVVSGDTLSEIAARYGTTVGAIKIANGLSGDLIRVGDELKIPAVGGDALGAVRLATERLRGGMRTWRYVVGHHSATGNGNADIFDRYHRKIGMQNGLAYHFVIGNGSASDDGQIEVGSRWPRQLHGGHVKSWEVNRTGIGICLVGNFEEARPSAKQMESFYSLIAYLRSVVPNRLRTKVHKEVDGSRHTVCPGRNFPIAEMHRRFPDQW